MLESMKTDRKMVPKIILGVLMPTIAILAGIFLPDAQRYAHVYEPNSLAEKCHGLSVYMEAKPPATSSTAANDTQEQIRVTFTAEEILYDFDYMIAVLEANFPSFGIIYRRNGVDMLSVAQDLREQLERKEGYISFTTFVELLREDFFRFTHPVGHLRIAGLWELGLVKGRFYGLQPFYQMLSMHSGLRLDSSWIFIPPVGRRRLTTQIIEDGRIAYLAYAGLMDWAMSRDDRHILEKFADEISGFEHLIIDMRDSRGGHPRFFYEFIAPLFAQNFHQTTIRNFYQAGDHNISHMRLRRGLIGAPFDISQVGNIFPGEYLSQEILDDLSAMDYMFTDTIAVWPRGNFNGKIWMLVGPYMFSASQTVATFAESSGFATLVGETTGGMAVTHSISSNYFALPNTSIVIRYDHAFITDSRGRPLEYGTEPHYFNRPGMDAMETVLALIEEGWYRRDE